MDSINVIFELLVNLFQGMMFVTFCYKFLTPSKKQITNRISYCSAVTLMFLSITLINYLYISFAYIETIVFFAIMIPYCVLFFEDRLFIKIITPLSLNVLYAVISFGLNYFFSAFINCDYNYLMTESTTYRYIYVILSNLIFVVILYLIYHLFKEQLHMMRLRNVFLSLIMPVAGIIVATLTFLVSSNASIPNSNRIILGLVSIIIICFTFMNFYLIKNISNNYALQKENLVANKEKEIYRLEIANSERYIREVSAIKHNIKNQLLCIETLIDEQNYIEAKKVCNNINDNIKITDSSIFFISPLFKFFTDFYPQNGQIVKRSKNLTARVGRFSSGLIEPTKIVFVPANLPTKMSVNGLSPITTTFLGLINKPFIIFFTVFGQGLFAWKYILQGMCCSTFSIYSLFLLFETIHI